jgi:hypothetical protein
VSHAHLDLVMFFDGVSFLGLQSNLIYEVGRSFNGKGMALVRFSKTGNFSTLSMASMIFFMLAFHL